MQELYNKLYVHLATEMHSALNQLIHQTAAKAHHRAGPHKPHAAKGGSKGSEGPSKHQLAVLKGLADEAELTADLTAAERYHQERVLAPANAQVSWASLHVIIYSTHQAHKTFVNLRGRKVYLGLRMQVV